MSRAIRNIASLFILVLAVLAARPAVADTVNCTQIKSLPAVISTYGSYCLMKNLAYKNSSGSAIEIKANKVTLDLNGHILNGMAGGPKTEASAIKVTLRKSVVIRNGTVRGFRTGILVLGSESVRIENMRVDASHDVGIFLTGYHHVVENNLIVGTGSTSNPAYINPKAIYLHSGKTSRVKNNIISGVARHPGGHSYGIYVATWFSNVAVLDNRIMDTEVGIKFYTGNSGHLYKGNIANNTYHAYDAVGANDGGNYSANPYYKIGP